MTTHTVLFRPYDKLVKVKDGESLIRSAMESGVHINASCGGEGVCGKCRIIIESGEVEGGISEKLEKEDIKKGIRLACLAKVKEDIVVRITTESTVDASVLNLLAVSRNTARIQKINFEAMKEKGLFIPPVEKRYIEMPSPTAHDNLSDITRLVSYLKLNYNESKLEVDLSVIRKIPDVLRENDFKITVTLIRPVHEGNKTKIVNVQPGNTVGSNYAIAIDVGTTTVYGQIIDLITGEVLAQHGDFNGQISYGEDVISRIVFAEKGGLDKLSEVVLTTINKIIKKIIKRASISSEDISTVTIAGNTTMTQLMLRINPRYIRLAPYVPASTLYPPFKTSEIGLDIEEHVRALIYPEVSSYVGGDIVAGVMGSGMYLSDEFTLFMDIGTNAEIVIGNKDWLACSACSAGPAFEGGGLKFGMRAAKGAVEDFSVDPFTLEPMIMTIGNVRPKGICGSGLIAIVATMFEMGIIDSSGKYDRNLDTLRIIKKDGVYEYVIAWANETQIEKDLSLSEIDIENLIRAKGAMYSGCITLLEEVGLSVTDLDLIIISGGFGSYVDLEKAMTIGLLPEVDPKKVQFIGNGSLMGARMSSLTNRLRKDVVEVTKMMTNFELSETASYMDNYIAAIFLPHTDISQFPKLKQRMASRKKLVMGRRSI